MSSFSNFEPRSRDGGRRLPSWAGYLLIAVDVIAMPSFLALWLGTVLALALVMPTPSLWLEIGFLVVASIATWAGVVRAVAAQASRRGALGAYVGRLATQTNIGRWLTDWLSGSKS